MDPENYASRAAAILATIGGAIQSVYVAGYYAAGDGGAALYKRVGSAPSHAGWFQSADGAYWEIAELFISVEMFGAKGDGSTDDGVAIQSAHNYLYDRGGGVLRFAAKHYGFKPVSVSPTVSKPLILASGVIFEGQGKGATILERLDSANNRSFLVGTYGPVSSNSPRLETKYDIADATFGDSQVTLLTVADAANFSVGDTLFIQGTTAATPSGGGVYNPNMLTSVTAIDAVAGILYTEHAIDAIGSYKDNGTVKPGVRRLNAGTSSGLSDITGRAWPLEVAIGAGIRNMTLKQDMSAIGWSMPSLCIYKSFMENVAVYAKTGPAGNPVAYSRFENCEWQFKDTGLEFAYGSHDTVVRDSIFTSVGNSSATDLGLWVNDGEGAKRITFDNIQYQGRKTRSTRPNRAVHLHSNSVLVNSTVNAPYSLAVEAFSKSVIENCKIRGASDQDYAVILSSSNLRNSYVAGGDSNAVLVDGASFAEGNTIASIDGLTTNTIYARNNPELSLVRRNVTRTSRPNEIIARRNLETTLTEASGVVTPLSASISDIVLGSNFNLTVDLAFTIVGSGAGRISLQFNSVELTGVNYSASSGTRAFVHMEIRHVGPNYTLHSYVGQITYGTTVQAFEGRTNGSVNSSLTTLIETKLTGLTTGDTVVVTAGSMTLVSTGNMT